MFHVKNFPNLYSFVINIKSSAFYAFLCFTFLCFQINFPTHANYFKIFGGVFEYCVMLIKEIEEKNSLKKYVKYIQY